MEVQNQMARGWFESIKSKFQEFIQQLDLSWPKMTEYGIALGSGFFAGFLVKRYGRQAIITFIIFGGVLFGLHYFEIITIDWMKVKEFSGFAPTGTIETFFQDYWQWAKMHVITVTVAIVGFLIGFKIG